MTKHSHSPYTSTYSSTPHNTNRKHNIHHIPYTNTHHISTLQGYKNTIFNNGRYTTNIPTDPHTVTTTDIKTNMRHIHTSIVSRHLATRGKKKKKTHLHHLSCIVKLECKEECSLPSFGCLIDQIINHFTSLRFTDNLGDPRGFRIHLVKNGLPKGLLKNERGNNYDCTSSSDWQRYMPSIMRH